jgi:hypothetical protein
MGADDWQTKLVKELKNESITFITQDVKIGTQAWFNQLMI